LSVDDLAASAPGREAADSAKPDTPAGQVQISSDLPDEASTVGDGTVDLAASAQPLRVYTPASLPPGDPSSSTSSARPQRSQHLALAVEAEGPVPEMVLFRRWRVRGASNEPAHG
jgi:hypothetical protein